MMLRTPKAIYLLASSQCQVLSIYFDLRSAFELVSHTVLLHKLCAHGLSDGHVHWFCSYLSNQQSSAYMLVTFSLPFKVFSGVPQECFQDLCFLTY